MEKTAYIFPGITSLNHIKPEVHEQFKKWLSPYYDDLSILLNSDIKDIIYKQYYQPLNSIQVQVISYGISCAIYDYHKDTKGSAAYISGYSMGIFAACYAARVFSFPAGAKLLTQLNRLIADTFADADQQFFMATVVGLPRHTLLELLQSFIDIELVNQNSPINLILAGRAGQLPELEQQIYAAGATAFKQLPINYPYHSSLLRRCQPGWRAALDQTAIGVPVTPIISATTTRLLTRSEECRTELENNFCSAFSWLAVLETAAAKGITELYECGPGRDLAKIGRYSGITHTYHEFTT